MSAPAFTLRCASGRTVAVAGGRIAPSGASTPFVADLEDVAIRPGLVNAHDHLTLNHYPRLGRPPYRSMYAWVEDVQPEREAVVERLAGVTSAEAALFGALKNLLGGATTVAHHDRWCEALDDPRFPVRVARVRVVHSLGLEPERAAEVGRQRREGRVVQADPSRRDGEAAVPPLCIHLAEGRDPTLAREVAEAETLGLLGPDALAVHVVAADADGGGRLERSGTAVVWCPTSSRRLYQAVAPRALFRTGLDVLLGTDSLLSARGTLLHELAAARRTGRLGARRLEAAVGSVAARRLALEPPALTPGAPADLVALRRPLLRARGRDVALVVTAGRPRYGDAGLRPLFDAAGVETEPLRVDGWPKLVEAPLGTVARKVFRLSPETRRILR